MENSIKAIRPLSFPWETSDPFLFCVHHEDFYPKGNGKMGPSTGLEGRSLGNDFTVRDGYRMYHGTEVPGFPAHPHRGFETVTIVRTGVADHADSMGGTGRFGNGDVQWMTAGKGVQHSEMFPLLKDDAENPFELFQIWLNLPANKKMVNPYYHMLWSEDIPTYTHTDENGKTTKVSIVAGAIEDTIAPKPTPDSWAADPANEVAIWNIKMEPGARWELPVTENRVNRRVYFFKGSTLKIDETDIPHYNSAELYSIAPSVIQNGDEEAELLLLQGKPIDEPVVQYGPVAMNSQQEIQQTMVDYQKDQFGGWPWGKADFVHSKEKEGLPNMPMVRRR